MLSDRQIKEIEEKRKKNEEISDKVNMKCSKCSRVTGKLYKYPDGKTRGISLVKLDNKYVCSDCFQGGGK